MTADKLAPASGNDFGTLHTNALGRWQWVPDKTSPPVTPRKANKGASSQNTVEADQVEHRTRASRFRQQAHWTCAFGHPVAQPDVGGHTPQLSSPTDASNTAKCSDNLEGGRTDRPEVAPLQGAAHRATGETNVPGQGGSVTAAVNHSSSALAEASTSADVATRCVQPSNHLVVDPALLAAMLASVSVTSSADRPSSLPPTMPSQSGSSQSMAGATQSVEGLLFYHRDPIVPIPAGMTPLPPLPSSERPSPPDISSSSGPYWSSS